MIEYCFDVETNGLLPTLDRIHVLHMVNVKTREAFTYRRNEDEDTIEEGIKRLSAADKLTGHNIIGFDLKAVRKVFPDFDFQGEIHDTLVSIRLLPIEFKQKDSVLHKRGKLPSKLIGSHSLDAWGYRLGRRKGDYAKDCIEKNIDPWATWNQDMEDYCVNDVEVNLELLKFIEGFRLNKDVLEMEQATQEVVTYMEQSGYPFNLAEAEKLIHELQSQFDTLIKLASENVCGRYVADKKHVVSAIWHDPEGIQASREYKKPRFEWGEDYSRAIWADITIPKMTSKSSDPTKRGDRTEGAAYCKIKWQAFSPTSRDHVRYLLRDKYDWKPQHWTPKGNPSVDDISLRALIDTVPIANTLADIYLIQKLLGYLANGAEAWVKKYNPNTGKIHPYTNIGGTVTGRCSHHGPNIGQVPSVEVGPDDKPVMGLAGGYGWECRALFHTPDLIHGDPWCQVGVDLSGIEFRMLAENMAEFDGGEIMNVIVSGQDIHRYNMAKTGIESRSVIKRGLYGLLYGAGDEKLGATVAPDTDPGKWQEAGRRFRSQIMEGLPALKHVVAKYKRQAESGYIIGLDGRKLLCRSPHSSLNTKLQSDGALVAKRWVIFIEDFALDAGLDHGWSGDFAMMAFIHDEVQSAVKAVHAQKYAELCVEAAAESGRSFGLKCPIGAEYKIGHNWAETH